MGLLENYKDIVNVVRQIDNIELYRQILGLQAEIQELVGDNLSLKEELSAMIKKLAFAGKLTFEPPLYYAEGDSTPYCPRCWEDHRKAIHLPPEFKSGAGPVWDCLACKAQIIDRSKKPSAVVRRRGSGLV